MMMHKRFFNLIAVFFVAAFSCSTALAQDFDEDEFAMFEAEFASSSSSTEVYDPFETVNRKIHVFNDVTDRYLLNPVVKSYEKYAPDRVRRSVHNFVVNLSLPLSVVNSLLQGKLDNGLATFSHFVINSTIGVFGLFDIAGAKNIKYEREDFGQTLGFYGAGPGPYIVLPILGPSNLRDTTGRTFDSGVDVMGFNLLRIGGGSDMVEDELRVANVLVSGLDRRAQLNGVINDIRKESFDEYVTMRSYYSQNREEEIKK